MTVSTTTNKIKYSGNGAQKTFAYNFKIFDADDLEVYLVDSDGVETLQSDYTVTGVGNINGGNVVFGLVTPSATEEVFIRRIVDIIQDTDYVPGDPFPADAHEDALDYQIMIDQQINEVYDRTIVAPISETGTTLIIPSVTTRASRFFTYDASGNPAASVETVEQTSTHSYLDGLLEDDHTQYILVSGTRPFLGTVGGITPTADAHLSTKGYVDTADGVVTAAYVAADVIVTNAYIAADVILDTKIDTTSGTLQLQLDGLSIDHGDLTGLGDDDHTQYLLRTDFTTYSGAMVVDWTAADVVLDTKIDTTSGTLQNQIDGLSIDHGDLTGLGDDDHTQYLLADGSRDLAGDWDFSTYTISGTGDIYAGNLYGNGAGLTGVIATVTGSSHAELDNLDYALDNLDYASAGHTGFASTEYADAAASGTGQTGQYSIADAIDEFTISFSPNYEDTSYDVVGQMVNTTDGDPADYSHKI